MKLLKVVLGQRTEQERQQGPHLRTPECLVLTSAAHTMPRTLAQHVCKGDTQICEASHIKKKQKKNTKAFNGLPETMFSL